MLSFKEYLNSETWNLDEGKRPNNQQRKAHRNISRISNGISRNATAIEKDFTNGWRDSSLSPIQHMRRLESQMVKLAQNQKDLSRQIEMLSQLKQ